MAKSMKEYGYSMCSMSTSTLDLLRALKKRDSRVFKDILEDALELYMAKYPAPRAKKVKAPFSVSALRSMGGSLATVEIELE